MRKRSLPGSIPAYHNPTHRVAYWCPALRTGAGGWYVLGYFASALLAQQGATYAQVVWRIGQAMVQPV